MTTAEILISKLQKQAKRRGDTRHNAHVFSYINHQHKEKYFANSGAIYGK